VLVKLRRKSRVPGGHKKSSGKNKGIEPFETEELKSLEEEHECQEGTRNHLKNKGPRPFEVQAITSSREIVQVCTEPTQGVWAEPSTGSKYQER
jgi:hypothetical protein